METCEATMALRNYCCDVQQLGLVNNPRQNFEYRKNDAAPGGIGVGLSWNGQDCSLRIANLIESAAKFAEVGSADGS